MGGVWRLGLSGIGAVWGGLPGLGCCPVWAQICASLLSQHLCISVRSGDPMGREPLKGPVQNFQVPGQVLTLNLRCSQSKGLKVGMSS